jgi:ferredoxin-type protein NapG
LSVRGLDVIMIATRPMSKDDEAKRVSRRQLLTFWRRPLDEALAAHRPPPKAPPAPPPVTRPPPLRPPGMLHELLLQKHCIRCGKCVEVCPANAIFPLGPEWGPSAAGTPAIEARKKPCVLCTGLKCTHVCPSGALLPTFMPHDVTMGKAILDTASCVTWNGATCTACKDACPQSALTIDSYGRMLVVEDKCVGCGLCERPCPTEPQSIRVRPRG